MVRAILEGRKTQTRRVVKAQPKHTGHGATFLFDRGSSTQYYWIPNDISIRDTSRLTLEQCPYGKPGDRLWVKEAYYAWGKWVHNGKTKSGRQAWKFVQVGTSIRYMDENKPSKTAKRDGECGWVYRHGRFMPKKHSRQTVEITDVRAHRLQEISEEDAKAEGVEPFRTKGTPAEIAWYAESHPDGYRTNFPLVWDSINERDAWDSNPWVWAITFKRIQESL
jgi:hypothetical protein